MGALLGVLLLASSVATGQLSVEKPMLAASFAPKSFGSEDYTNHGRVRDAVPRPRKYRGSGDALVEVLQLRRSILRGRSLLHEPGAAGGCGDRLHRRQLGVTRGRRPGLPSARARRRQRAHDAVQHFAPGAHRFPHRLFGSPRHRDSGERRAHVRARHRASGRFGPNSFLGYIEVYWRRTVSAPPASATFADVPSSHPYFQFIEALASSG